MSRRCRRQGMTFITPSRTPIFDYIFECAHLFHNPHKQSSGYLFDDELFEKRFTRNTVADRGACTRKPSRLILVGSGRFDSLPYSGAPGHATPFVHTCFVATFGSRNGLDLASRPWRGVALRTPLWRSISVLTVLPFRQAPGSDMLAT